MPPCLPPTPRSPNVGAKRAQCMCLGQGTHKPRASPQIQSFSSRFAISLDLYANLLGAAGGQRGRACVGTPSRSCTQKHFRDGPSATPVARMMRAASGILCSSLASGYQAGGPQRERLQNPQSGIRRGLANNVVPARKSFVGSTAGHRRASVHYLQALQLARCAVAKYHHRLWVHVPVLFSSREVHAGNID